MRTPRPQDFATTANKTIQPEAVDVSDIDPIKPKPELEKQHASAEPVRDERPVRKVRSERPVRSTDQSVSQKPQPPKKREIKRHAFEIYRDQWETLKQLKMTTMLTGELVSMSEMVREALDSYINNNEKPSGANGPYE